MKRLELKLFFLAGPALLLVLGVAAVCPGSSGIGLLSEAQLAALEGGSSEYCWSGSATSSYSNCEAHECEDIACSPCGDSGGGGEGYCEGNGGDHDMVENCYRTDTASDCCSGGTNSDVGCDGGFWNTDDSCGGVPDEGVDLLKEDCTGC